MLVTASFSPTALAGPRVIEVGSEPVGIAVAPDGPHAYVANSGSNTVSVIDITNGAVTGTIVVGTAPWGVAIAPDGLRVYVSNVGSGTVSVIDTAAGTVVATIGGFTLPQGLALTPDGARVYVANSGSATVSVIDTAAGTVTDTIAVGPVPHGVVVGPDGLRAYVTNAAGNTVSVINTLSRTVVATIGGFILPHGLALTPDGTRLFVANSGGTTLAIIDTATNAISATVTLAHSPQCLAASPDGTLIYATMTSVGMLSVINPSTSTVTHNLTGFDGPFWPATTPDGHDVYVTNNTGGTVTVLRRPASVTPNFGSHCSGTALTITGEGFTGTSRVRFGPRRAKSFTATSDSTLAAVTPARVGGAAPITVTASGGTAVVGRFYYRHMPILNTISQPSGPKNGGNVLTITGKWLTGIKEVRFGTTTAIPTVLSDSELTVTAPPSALAGAIPVHLTTPGGVSNTKGYTYLDGPVITSITPSSGPGTGSRPLNINGTGLAQVTSVTFGGNLAAFRVMSDIKVQAITPPGTPGPAAVVVTTATGATASSPTPYTYT